mgnify:FL=1|tara:strand:+ start:432 stop:677 length:246 start_codon:yes stop_codon:yes gene_type:complete
MNDIMIFIYLLAFTATLGATFAFMFKMMTSTLADMDKPIKRVKMPAPHPEMEGVKYGEELLIYTPEIEEDDDDDGDIVVRP